MLKTEALKMRENGSKVERSKKEKKKKRKEKERKEKKENQTVCISYLLQALYYCCVIGMTSFVYFRFQPCYSKLPVLPKLSTSI